MDLNINPIKELLVLLNGPLFQIIAYFILLIIIPSERDIIIIYHYGILLFNLLPIYPLDGGKIVNLFIQVFIPYKLALKVVIFISYIIVILLFIFLDKKINTFIIVLFLSFLIFREYRRINYIYNKFILERYLKLYKFKKSKIINNINNLYRNRRHLIKENDRYFEENEYFLKKIKKF
jgi:stage IV sporulation protein FB